MNNLTTTQIATAAKSGHFSTASLVCFPCRKRSSLERPGFASPHAHHCPECRGTLVNVGTKLQVPPHADEKAWRKFYDQVTAPGYRTDISGLDPWRDGENKHWGVCLLRGSKAGCERCRGVAERTPVVDWNRYGKN